MNNKSIITIQVIDFLTNPIAKIQYQIKNNHTGKGIAEGVTNKSGCIVDISRDKGTVLDVYLKSQMSKDFSLVKSIPMTKDRMIVRIMSPKILMNLKTLENQGSSGQYKRKTHIVKKGETLTSIAKENHTTVKMLANLNQIKDVDKLSIGQVVKLPVHLPALGNNRLEIKQPPRKVQNKPKQTENSNGKLKSTTKIVTEVYEEAKIALERYYEDAKKILVTQESVKIETKDDRSAEIGTPKVDAINPCLTQPQCISSGKGEFIREINIRLAGFGGALPSNEFTELTVQCIKQFQRDYMGVPETGKICGSLLVALDKFYEEYPISQFMSKAPCPCGKCNGYGKNRRNVQWGRKYANEYPGFHRSLIWIMKALNFYLKNEFKARKMEIACVESGYRCIDNNVQKGRTSVNHMGLAFDLHIKKEGHRTRDEADIEFIRKTILIPKMQALESRQTNRIYLEPATFSSGSAGARTWIHFDLTAFSNVYFEDLLFKKSVVELNGFKLVSFLQNGNNHKVLACAFSSIETPILDQQKDALVLSEDDIIDIMKVTETEVIKFKNDKYFEDQAAGVVDTILNRVKSQIWGISVRCVVNANRQFSKITGPQNLEPYGSVEKMPFSKVSKRIRDFVNKYLVERAQGRPSIIGEHLNYANKYYSDAKNRKQWVDAFHDNAVKQGMILGYGKSIHAHGTVPELQNRMPKPFIVILPKNFNGI